MKKQDLLKIAKAMMVNREVAKLLPMKTMTRRVINTTLENGIYKQWI